MNHLPFTLTAYFFNALAVLSSKFLLNKAIPDPLIYVFYISLFSLPAILAIPFTNIPSLQVFFMASVSTLFWTTGAYFMYKALKVGLVSRVIPIIGTTVPLILLIFASGTNVLTLLQTMAVLTLILGMVVLTLPDWGGKFSKKELFFELMSAICFALAYVILRQAYLQLDFFSVIVWSRLVLLPLTLSVLLIPNFRRKIITSNRLKINFLSGAGMIFLGGQLSGVLSELLLLFSISLANPALVNSLQGTQYVFLLFFALVLSKKLPAVFQEKYTPLILILKLSGIGLISAGVYFLSIS